MGQQTLSVGLTVLWVHTQERFYEKIKQDVEADMEEKRVSTLQGGRTAQRVVGR